MPPVPIPTALNVPLALPAAGVGPRLLAWLLDTLIAIAYLIGVIWLFGTLGVRLGWATYTLIVYLPVVCYHLVSEIVLGGRSIGKMALSLRVVRLDGSAPGLGDYLLRWLLRIVEILALSGVGAIIAVAVTQRGQRLGDLAAGTTVVRTKQRTRLADTIYSRLGEQHTPAFPEVEFLSDADVQTVRDVLTRLRTDGRRGRDGRAGQVDQIARRAKGAIERKLGIEPVAMPPEAFLQRIVKDYNSVLDTYVFEPERLRV